jgi:hypothetical protein
MTVKCNTSHISDICVDKNSGNDLPVVESFAVYRDIIS